MVKNREVNDKAQPGGKDFVDTRHMNFIPILLKNVCNRDKFSRYAIVDLNFNT